MSLIALKKFTSSGTWTKESGTVECRIYVWAGGGGGASGGQSDSNNTAMQGGGGAPPVPYVVYTVDADYFGSSESVTVGGGGAGGVSQTSQNTDGNHGNAGGVSSVGSVQTCPIVAQFAEISDLNNYSSPGGSTTYLLPALTFIVNNHSVGNLYSSGTVPPYKENTTNEQITSFTSLSNERANDLSPINQYGDYTDRNFTSPINLLNYFDYRIASTGGGVGGALTSTTKFGTRGGHIIDFNTFDFVVEGGLRGDPDGTVDGGDGNASPANGLTLGGTGGGGGAGQTSTTLPGNGGNGGSRGAGGGGGGASLAGTNSGAGGDGADGEVWIFEYS